MKYTPNYNLNKPEGTDVVNIADLNANADIIDSELKERAKKDLSNVTDTVLAGKLQAAAQGGSITPGTIGAIGTDKIGQPNGVAGLDAGGKVPAGQLPAMNYVPTTRTVNGKALSANITLTAADVGASNRNLLDNWNFIDPVNQRGQNSYNDPWRYSIDRWIVSCALTLTDNGIVLNAPQDERAWFLQRLEHKYFDQLLTLTVLVNDTLYTVTGSMSSAEKNIIYKSIPNGNMAIEMDNDGDVQFVAFTANKGESITIQAAKLELGDKQTLARQDSNGQWVLLDPPNKALELAKCQRYYQHIPILYAPGIAISGTLCYVAVSVPVSMRIAPTSVALDLGILSAGGNQYTPSDIAIAACNNNQVHLGVLGSGFAMGDVCLLHDAVIALSADL